MIDKEIKIKIRSELVASAESYFSELNGEEELVEEGAKEDQLLEMSYIGRMTDDGERVSIIYNEGNENGLDNSKTIISFMKRSPKIVTMAREGAVSTTFVFEKGRRYQCVYNTPIMPFEVCIHTDAVENEIIEKKKLFLDYFVEIRGATADHTKFSLEIL